MEPLWGSRWAWFLILPPNAVFWGLTGAPYPTRRARNKIYETHKMPVLCWLGC